MLHHLATSLVVVLSACTLLAETHKLSAPTAKRRQDGAAMNCSEPDKNPTAQCPNPGDFVAGLLGAVNKSQNISEVIEGLKLPSGTVVGAHPSTSLQASRGTDDPRLYLFTPCGPITLTLYGKSIEMGINQQRVDSDLTDPVGGGFKKINSKDYGEILLDIQPFPRGKREFAASDIVNTYNPEYAKLAYEQYKLTGKQPAEAFLKRKNPDGGTTRVYHDTKKCSGCHADTGVTGGSLGQRRLRVGDQLVNAIVSAYERSPGEGVGGTQYCVPSDLEKLKDCTCSSTTAKQNQCQTFKSAEPTDQENTSTSGDEEESGPIRKLSKEDQQTRRTEACRRLDAVMKLNARQHCRFQPADGKCLAK